MNFKHLLEMSQSKTQYEKGSPQLHLQEALTHSI